MRICITTLVMVIMTLACFSQPNDKQEVERTIDRFLKYISFADTSSMKIDTLADVLTDNARFTANFGDKPMILTARQFVDNIRKNAASGKVSSTLEKELVSEVDVFGKIAHVLSTYELTIAGKNEKIVRRGLNSIQLIKQNGKWLICSVVWDRESDELKLPAEYLPR